MKKDVPRKKVILPLLLSSLLVVQIVTLLVVFPRDRETVPDTSRIFSHIEDNFNKQNYSTAEALAVSILMKDPADIDGALWLEKIAEERKRIESTTLAPVTREKTADPREEQALREQLIALRNLKKSVDDMKNNSRTPPVIISTVKDSKFVQTNNKEAVDPADLERFYTAGVRAYHEGDFPTAKENLRKVLAADPENPQANSYFGAALFEENPQNEEQLRTALHYSKKAIESDKSNKLAYETLGKIYESGGNRELAIANYLEASALDPRDTAILFRIGRIYYLLRENEKAQSSLLKAVSLNSNLPFAHYYLALIARDRGDDKQAVRYLTSAVNHDRKFYGAYSERGEILFSLKEFDAAWDDFKTAVSLRDDFNARVRIGDCLLRMDRIDDAMGEYRYVLEHTRPAGVAEKKRAGELFRTLAIFYEKNGKPGDAYDVIQKAVSAGYEIPVLYVLKGRIEVLKNETESARESFRRAISLDPGAADGYCELALLYKRQGKKTEAGNVMRELNGKIPGSSELPKVREILEQLNQ